MLYCYYRDLPGRENKVLIQTIKLNNIKMSQVYIDESINGSPELDELLRELKPGDKLIVSTITDLDSNNAKVVKKILKYFEVNKINLSSLEEPAISGTDTYSRLTQALKLDKYYRDTVREYFFRKAVEKGTVGRPKTNQEKIIKSQKMYNSGIFKISEILETTGLSKTLFYNELKKVVKT